VFKTLPLAITALGLEQKLDFMKNMKYHTEVMT